MTGPDPASGDAVMTQNDRPRDYRPSLKSWFNPTLEERAANRRLFFSFEGRVGRQTYWQFAAVPSLAIWS